MNSTDMFLYNSEYILLLVARIRVFARSLYNKTLPIFTNFFTSKLHEPISVAGLRGSATLLFMGLRVQPAMVHGIPSVLSVACCQVADRFF